MYLKFLSKGGGLFEGGYFNGMCPKGRGVFEGGAIQRNMVTDLTNLTEHFNGVPLLYRGQKI